MELNGCTALVTGGASGLGEATVERLVLEGARVLVLDRDPTRGAALSQRLGPAVHFQALDVTDEAQAEVLIASLGERFGELHLCVNAAGIGFTGATATAAGPMALSDFRRLIDVNLVGTFNIARLVAARMIHNATRGTHAERGLIIHTSSIAGLEAPAGMVAYGASKAAVAAMTLPMARDLAPFGIRVCTIAPGMFDTPMLANLPPALYAELQQGIPFPKRSGRPEEYAALVCSIAANAYLNGAVIRLDGCAR